MFCFSKIDCFMIMNFASTCLLGHSRLQELLSNMFDASLYIECWFREHFISSSRHVVVIAMQWIWEDAQGKFESALYCTAAGKCTKMLVRDNVAVSVLKGWSPYTLAPVVTEESWGWLTCSWMNLEQCILVQNANSVCNAFFIQTPAIFVSRRTIRLSSFF